MPPPRHLLIVDDDLLSREVLSAVAQEAGFTTQAFEDGDQVLAHLALHRASPPAALLVDMQMPGLTGNPLALRLRAATSAATLLIAMSGSSVPAEHYKDFDTFLLKPFDFLTFLSVLEGAPQHAAPAQSQLQPQPEVLAEATYTSLAAGMTPTQLQELYTLCLDDAERRMGLVRHAALAGDDDAYRRGAHSIKGGCGMVGAMQMAALASAMEEDGPPPVDDASALDKIVNEFLHASSRLRSILSARSNL